MARPQVVDGGDGLLTWMVAADISNKKSRIVNNGVVLQLGGWVRG
jgi:hypothetical protein